MTYRIFDGYTTRDATPEQIERIEQAQQEEQEQQEGELNKQESLYENN